MKEPVPHVATVSQLPRLHPPKYHITAINPLTRQREAVTLPCSKEKADKILAKEKRKPPRKRTWKYPKVEIYTPPQQQLCFKHL